MNTRIETKHLFSENTSPDIKRLVMMKRSGIPLNENQQKRLERFSESKWNEKNNTDEEEIDLDEILREMGYSDDDYSDIPDREDYIDMIGIRKGELKELIRQMVREYFDETFESPEELDLNQIIENLTNQ